MKNILKYTIWTGIYATLIVPFIVANEMFFPYITGKAFVFRIIVEIILGLWLILIIKDEKFRPKWSWVLGAIALFVLVLFFADVNAVAPHKAFWSNSERMEGFVTFAHLLAYFLVLGSMLNTEKLWLWFFRTLVISPYLFIVYKYFELSYKKAQNLVSAQTPFNEYINMVGDRFSGPLGNPIYIAVFFLFLFFLTLILLYKDVLVKNLTDWKIFRKVFSNVLFYVYLVISILSIYVVYRTSRGALLGAIGGIFMGAILIAIFEKQKKVIRHIAFAGILSVVAVVVIFLGVRDTQYVQNNNTLSRLAEISWSNTNGQARQLVWPMALKGYKEKPILGWGQEGFNYVFNKYYDPRMYGQEAWFDRAHNAPLDFLVAGGTLGFLSYLSLFGSVIYLLWFRKNSSDRGTRGGNLSITERALVTGLLAGYLFQAIFVFDNLISYLMFFIILSYVHSQIVEEEERKKGFKYFSNFISNEEYQNYILIPIVVILTTVCVWWVNVPHIQANQTLIQAFRLVQSGRTEEGLNAFKKALAYESLVGSEIREQLLSYATSLARSTEVSDKIKNDFALLTIDELEQQIAKVPNDARYYILMGSFLNNIGHPEKALLYVEKAVELSPLKQAMRFELIQTLYALGRVDEALVEAKSAYELDTNYEQAKTIYEAVQKAVEGK